MRRLLLALWLLASPAYGDTLVVTFAFASDAQGFTFSNGGDSFATGSWTGGVLQSVRTHKGANGSNNTWTLATTWTGLGVPSGATITGVTSASMQSQCTTFTSAGSGNTSGATTLVDGATTVTLSTQRTFTATDGSPVTTNGTDATGLSLAAANSITLTIPNHLQNANTTGSSVILSQDQLVFTITYTPAAPPASRRTLTHAGG